MATVPVPVRQLSSGAQTQTHTLTCLGVVCSCARVCVCVCLLSRAVCLSVSQSVSQTDCVLDRQPVGFACWLASWLVRLDGCDTAAAVMLDDVQQSVSVCHLSISLSLFSPTFDCFPSLSPFCRFCCCCCC